MHSEVLITLGYRRVVKIGQNWGELWKTLSARQNKAMKGRKSNLKSEWCFAATNSVVIMMEKALEIKIKKKKNEARRYKRTPCEQQLSQRRAGLWDIKQVTPPGLTPQSHGGITQQGFLDHAVQSVVPSHFLLLSKPLKHTIHKTQSWELLQSARPKSVGWFNDSLRCFWWGRWMNERSHT